MIEHSYWILFLPLISALVIFFFGRYLPMKGALLGIFATGICLLQSSGILLKFVYQPELIDHLRIHIKNPDQYAEILDLLQISIPWLRFGIHEIDLAIFIDGLTALMLVVVTLVSFLVHIYSLGYMHYGEPEEDPRFKRYYAYLSFFTFAMLLLVVANNFLQLFIGWELVGVASYLLIGFWFEKSSAAYAGKKAFITTKLGDLGFFVGIMMIFARLGTLNFIQVERHVQAGSLIFPQTAFVIGLLLFCGAIGKSAQTPLHVWLPDAMEGPTPVSALIHAATMVAAGVFMVARTYFIFDVGLLNLPLDWLREVHVLDVVGWVGGITALLAATMALVATDIKRVLAFSTVSQLGYMMLAMGVGGRTAGMFHLTTHAFFKALLFLAAGSVIHAVHTNDIREMGGLSKKMIWTFATFLCAWVAISGIPPFAGFFSKDAILEAAFHSGHHALFWLAVFVAFLTSFYMTRLLLLVFWTEPRNIEKFSHASESPYSMTVPLVVLAILSLLGGMIFQYGVDLNRLLEMQSVAGENSLAESAVGSASKFFVPTVSSLAALAGIVLSFLFYLKKFFSADALAEAFRPVYKTLVAKYGFDELYLSCFVKPADLLAQGLARIDFHLVDQIGVDGVGWFTAQLSKIQNWIDDVIVDGLVDFWGKLCQSFSVGLKKIQTGFVQNYLLIFVLGFGLLLFWKLEITFAQLLELF